jgi:hypothetical protein
VGPWASYGFIFPSLDYIHDARVALEDEVRGPFYCAGDSHLPLLAVYTPGHLFDLSLTNLAEAVWAHSELTNYEPSPCLPVFTCGYARQTPGDTLISWP